MLSEFKTFIMRGNVVDLAIGVIIGAHGADFFSWVRFRPAGLSYRSPRA